MNLIEILAKRAGYEVDMFGIGHWEMPEFQKYSELMLQECIQYLTNEAERLYSLRNDNADLCAEKCYDNIQGLKEHFGVE